MTAEPGSSEALVQESERLREHLSATVGELRSLCDALRDIVRDLREAVPDKPPDGRSDP